MREIRLICLFLLSLLLTGCFSIPGYVSKDGSITPPYSSEILIESLQGTVVITPVETSKGISNVNPTKSDPLRSQKQDMIILNEGSTYYFNLEGNHNVVFGFRTLEKEATFRITYKDEATECTIHSSDFTDKLIYIENY